MLQNFAQTSMVLVGSSLIIRDSIDLKFALKAT